MEVKKSGIYRSIYQIKETYKKIQLYFLKIKKINPLPYSYYYRIQYEDVYNTKMFSQKNDNGS